MSPKIAPLPNPPHEGEGNLIWTTMNIVMKRFLSFVIFSFLIFSGCASSRATAGKALRPQAPGESPQEVVSAMENVLGAVSGKNVDQKQLENLGKQIQKDPQAKSALQAISDSVSGQGKAIKYCPVDGERFSPKFETCPVHHVPLKSLGD